MDSKFLDSGIGPQWEPVGGGGGGGGGGSVCDWCSPGGCVNLVWEFHLEMDSELFDHFFLLVLWTVLVYCVIKVRVIFRQFVSPGSISPELVTTPNRFKFMTR